LSKLKGCQRSRSAFWRIGFAESRIRSETQIHEIKSWQPGPERLNMGWKGKVIGGSIGFVIGGPVGAVAGAAVGHSFDLEGEKQACSRTRQRPTGQLRKPSHVPYEILKCNPTDPDDRIKRQYRRLVQEYHPDRIASLDLPPEFNQLAHDRFREITQAYEVIKKERGLS
jgi:hypothetical protein